MRAPVKAPKSDRNRGNQHNRPAASAYAQDDSVTHVKAPLLAQQQQNYDTLALETEEQYQKQRLSDIEQVQRETEETNAVFRDFKVMIDDQQGGLDTAEQGVEKSTDHVVKGTEQLKRASEIQKCSRKMMCCLIVVIVVVVAIVMIVLYAKGDL